MPNCNGQVFEGKTHYVDMAGNLVPVTKSGDQPCFTFRAFHENRVPLVVRVRDQTQPATGRIAFMTESRLMRGDSPPNPACALNLALPDFVPGSGAKTEEENEEELERHEEREKTQQS